MRRFLVEASWEIANKVGGIHTVLKEKSFYIKNEFGEDYLVIGPFLPEKSFQEFNRLDPPSDFKDIINESEKAGVGVYYGEWLVESRPKGFLIDFKNFSSNPNLLKYELWEKYRIDSRRTGFDYDQPVAWSKATALFLKNFDQAFSGSKKIIHLHEWLAGGIILFDGLTSFKKVFTTHATVLGRSLAANQINFWEHLDLINPETEAYRLGVEAKHSIEKFSAQKADYFSCVSAVLAVEAEKFLGRKVDAILPNGLNFSRFPTVEEITYAHRSNKNNFQDFLLYFFAPFYKVELKNSLIYFISGRPEIKNKGIDVFIQALGQLKQKLQAQSSAVQIFVFLFVPNEAKTIDPVLERNLNIYRELGEKIENFSHEIKSRLVHFLIHKEKISPETLFTPDEFLEIQGLFQKIQKENRIPLSTYVLRPDDEIVRLLIESGLTNQADDLVKVVYYPTYLSRVDGLLNLSYFEAISGCHLGVFPSFYEPWGYTPLETSASGVVTITTDLTGFADYLERNAEFDLKKPGIFVVKRKTRRDKEVVDDLAKIMFEFSQLNHDERVQNKLEARRLAVICDWRKFIINYLNLYDKIFKDEG